MCTHRGGTRANASGGAPIPTAEQLRYQRLQAARAEDDAMADRMGAMLREEEAAADLRRRQQQLRAQRLAAARAEDDAMSDRRSAMKSTQGVRLDFTAEQDHYRIASKYPRQVAAYLNKVKTGAFRTTATGARETRTFTPDTGSPDVKTGLKVTVTRRGSGVQISLRDKSGIELSTASARTMDAGEKQGRSLLASELRRRGIY